MSYVGRLFVHGCANVCDRNCWLVIFFIHCAQMPSTRGVAAGLQREAHSRQMREVCFSEPLHFCSCLTFKISDLLFLMF